MKNLFLCFILLFLQLPFVVVGQNALSVQEDEGKRHSVPLNGKAEVVFVSKSKNLFIESSRPSLDTRLDPMRNRKGEWEYVIQLKLETKDGVVNERTFTITESGTTDMVNVPKKVYIANNRYVYSVKRNKNTIFLVENTQPGDAHMVKGEAAVEIHSLSEINVLVSPDLPCRMGKKRNEAGTYQTMLIIDMANYEKMRSHLYRNRSMYEQYNDSLITRAEAGLDVYPEEWDSLSRWQEQVEKEESKWSDISTIAINQEESNSITINVSNISAKQKLVYMVKCLDNTNGGRVYGRWRWMALTNYVFSPQPQHSFGLTIGNVGKYGWYSSLTTNGSFSLLSDYTVEDATTAQSTYLWSGEERKTRFSLVVGGVVALWNFGYFYTGVGYGIRNKIWYTRNGESVFLESEQYNGMLIDVGLMINASEHFLLSVGFDIQIPKTYYEFKIGAGIRF